MHVRRDDMVEVIAGNEAGKKGKILRAVPKKLRVYIEGVNMRWKNLRKSQKNPQGGRVQREMPVHVSNVKLVERAKESGAKKKVSKKKK